MVLVKAQVLAALEAAHGRYLSGQELADRLQVSRTAVWKAVAGLRADGVPIQAVTNRGYALPANADILHADAVAALLEPEVARALHIEVYDRLPGTNAALRVRAAQQAPEGLVLIAQAQSAGRGRSGRSFFSPPGGLYMSLLLRPEFSIRQSVYLTAMAAVAAARACETLCGSPIQIKWVNDLWKDGKKVCGILTEASMDVESGLLEYAIVGPGFNLVPPPNGWPPELEGIAGSLFDAVPPRRCPCPAGCRFSQCFLAALPQRSPSGFPARLSGPPNPAGSPCGSKARTFRCLRCHRAGRGRRVPASCTA